MVNWSNKLGNGFESVKHQQRTAFALTIAADTGLAAKASAV